MRLIALSFITLALVGATRPAEAGLMKLLGFGSEEVSRQSMLNGKPINGTAIVNDESEAPRPSFFSRVGQGTSRAVSRTTRAIGFKSKSSDETHSQYDGRGGISYPNKKKKGVFSSWLRPAEPKPPATVQDWLDQDRPRM